MVDVNHTNHAPVDKIKLVAIAKDESAYFPEWVMHHLSMGFDSIHIYINRSSDNSQCVLDKICESNPQVSYESVDWIDAAGSVAAQRLQFISYAMAFNQIKQEGVYSHICFLDIDEFWIHQDPDTTVHDFINQLSTTDVIFLEWLVDYPDPTPFSALSHCLTGHLSSLGKCILPTAIDIEQIHLHLPTFKGQTNVILADGKAFVSASKNRQSLAEQFNSLKPCFIFHRANRSQLEYISLSLRGRPSSEFPFKENRNGLPDKNKQKIQLELAQSRLNHQSESLQTFIDKCDLNKEILVSREFVNKRYNKAIEYVKSIIETEYDVLIRIFAGVTDSKLIEHFTAYRAKLVAKKPSDADLLRKMAQQAAHQNLDEALVYINEAARLRPSGPLIRKIQQRLTELKTGNRANLDG